MNYDFSIIIRYEIDILPPGDTYITFVQKGKCALIHETKREKKEPIGFMLNPF